MEIEVVKAERAYGFTKMIELINLSLDSSVSGEELAKIQIDFEMNKKPGFYKDRRIEVVDDIPNKLPNKVIYVCFNKNGYKIRSGGNFLYKSITEKGNLKGIIAKVSDNESYSKQEVIDGLRYLNNVSESNILLNSQSNLMTSCRGSGERKE